MTFEPVSIPSSNPAAPVAWRMFPHFELRQISPHGAVFRSNRACEPGTSFAFGIHLPSARRHRLVDLEAIVVDCRAAGGDTGLGWEVTLIFDSVTPAQVSALRAASRIPLHHDPFAAEGSLPGPGSYHRPGLN